MIIFKCINKHIHKHVNLVRVRFSCLTFLKERKHGLYGTTVTANVLLGGPFNMLHTACGACLEKMSGRILCSFRF